MGHSSTERRVDKFNYMSFLNSVTREVFSVNEFAVDFNDNCRVILLIHFQKRLNSETRPMKLFRITV